MTLRPWRGRAGALAVIAALLPSFLTMSPAGAEGCSGRPLEDALLPECGVVLEQGLTQMEWTRPRVQVRDALTPFTLASMSGEGNPLRGLQVWTEVRPNVYHGWVSGYSLGASNITSLEPGRTYWFVAQRRVAWSFPEVRTASVFESAQVVSLYGHPGVPFMGALGKYTPAAAATEAARVALQYDRVNGARSVIPALHLIASVAQAGPGADGRYLSRMPLSVVDEYVRATAAQGQLLFLDVQVGWGDPLTETRYYERALREPHVHLALDPEFATRSDGLPPGQAIGSLDAATINRVQAYLAGLVEDGGMPPKVLVLHQFRDDMLPDAEGIASVDAVDVVIDMDGFGTPYQKRWGYERYAHSSYAEYAGFKLFYDWDSPLLTPAEVQALTPAPPDYIIYQ